MSNVVKIFRKPIHKNTPNLPDFLAFFLGQN